MVGRTPKFAKQHCKWLVAFWVGEQSITKAVHGKSLCVVPSSETTNSNATQSGPHSDMVSPSVDAESVSDDSSSNESSSCESIALEDTSI